MDNKAAWKKFYGIEKNLFAFLNDCSQCLYYIGEDDAQDLSYRQYKTSLGTVLEKPPRFIHQVRKLLSKSYEGEYTSLVATLKKAYSRAAGNEFKKYPVRFPEFYRNVEQINISSNAAFSSKPLLPDDIVILKQAEQCDESKQSLMEDIIKLEQQGFYGSTIFEGSDGYNTTWCLGIPTDTICSFSKSGLVQTRKRTGVQYRALVRACGKSKGVRCKLGLMVLDEVSGALIVNSPPQAPRPHSYRAAGTQITLPIDIEVSFWEK